MMENTSYRPHNPGHDYYERGAYLVTLGDVNGVPSSTAYSQFHNLNMLAEEVCGG